MVVYLSKPMIMRINHMYGYQGWEYSEWWTCARAKENYDYEALMTSSLSDCTWLEKEWMFRLNNVTSFLALYFFFHLIHPSHILLAIPLFSFFTFLYIFSFFRFFPYSYFSLYFSLSWHLFKALNSSLSCMHTIWNFKLTMLETRRKFESRLCSRNAMYKRDV
jgi:hypothetical protein